MSHTATYAVGREKVREYAYAVGESDPRYLDEAKGHEWSEQTGRTMAANLVAVARALQSNPITTS